MDKNKTNIKERILYITDLYDINKEKFFSDLGISYANFKGVQKNSALNSDTVAKILDAYKEIDPDWLISGEGNHYRSTYNSINNYLDNDNEKLNKLFELNQTNNALQTELFVLKERLEMTNERLNDKIKIIESLEFKIFMLEQNKIQYNSFVNTFNETKNKSNVWLTDNDSDNQK